jgi:dTDP-4-amino-4,6-dideoxygalactose transaminase
VDEKEFGMCRDALFDMLKEWYVHARRFFYPLIFVYRCYRSISVNDSLAVARRVADRILTLPIYDGLELSDVEIICEIIQHLHHLKEGKPTANFATSAL